MTAFLRSPEIPVRHVASMARSGETVLLRALAAHSRIRVVHNLLASDTRAQLRLFEFLKTYAGDRIRTRERVVRPFHIRPDEILVVKQGVWEHPHPFSGIVLARNPVAIYASLRTYDKKEHGPDLDANWHFNVERLTRWLGDIDPAMRMGFESLSPIEQFCAFYNRRLGHLADLPLPVVRYEELVTDPEAELRRVAAALEIEFEAQMLHGHDRYASGHVGHGSNDLSLAIHPRSLEKYRQVVTREEFDEIVGRTAGVAARFGYDMRWEEIGLSPRAVDAGVT